MSVGVIWECHNYKASFPNLIPRNPKIALCVTEALDQGTQTPHHRDLFTNQHYHKLSCLIIIIFIILLQLFILT